MDRARFGVDNEMFEELRRSIEAWIIDDDMSEGQKSARLAMLAGFAIRANEFGQDGITLDTEGKVGEQWMRADD